MRVLALSWAAICGIGCSAVLGIEDPTPDFGEGTLISIAIGPDPLSLPLGVSQQLTAIGAFDDGSQRDITAQTEFSVEAGGSLTVTPTGLARAIAEGPSTVIAKLGRISGGGTALVGPAVPVRVEFGIGDFRLARLQRVRLRVLAVLTDDTRQDVTATAAYVSDNQAVASVTAPGQIDGGSQSGTATITASLDGLPAGTVRATVTPKPCRPVINEFQAGSAASPSDEWIEILNPCTTAIDVDDWTLVYRGANVDGALDSNSMVMLTGQLAPGELRLYAGQDFAGVNDGKWTNANGIMQQNNGGIALRSGPRDTGPIADAVAYGAVIPTHPFIEGNPLPAMMNGRSAQRLPFDGRDDDDGAADFTQGVTPTPRAPNAP